MGAVKICIGFICLVAAGSNWGVNSGVVATSLACGLLSPAGGERIVKCKKEDYEKVIRIAAKEIGVVERTGKNDGQRIAEYLGYCNIGTPAPYCAAWVSFCFGQAGYPRPRTAWSASLFPVARLVKEPKPGIVYGLYYPGLKRIGHCGLIESVRNELIYGIEANTNAAGLREGDGVWRKLRHKRSIHRFADWVK